MRAIGLVLLSIAIMALLLTDADAKRRSSAQGSQAAGAKGSWCATYPSQGLNDNCGYSSFNQCYQTAVLGRGGFCRPNPFPGSAYGTGYTWGSGPMRYSCGGFAAGDVAPLGLRYRLDGLLRFGLSFPPGLLAIADEVIE